MTTDDFVVFLFFFTMFTTNQFFGLYHLLIWQVNHIWSKPASEVIKQDVVNVHYGYQLRKLRLWCTFSFCSDFLVHERGFWGEMLPRNSEAMGVLVCILCVLLCAILIRTIIPCSLDYFGNDLCEIQGKYENKVGNHSTSGSSGLGFYAVRITTDDQDILDLTTIPLAQDYFPTGVYYVKAYYTQRSRLCVVVSKALLPVSNQVAQ